MIKDKIEKICSQLGYLEGMLERAQNEALSNEDRIFFDRNALGALLKEDVTVDSEISGEERSEFAKTLKAENDKHLGLLTHADATHLPIRSIPVTSKTWKCPYLAPKIN